MRSLALTALLLLGCAGTWVHPTKTRQEFYADRAECRALAGQAASAPTGWLEVPPDVEGDCMRGRGWELRY